MLGEMFKLTCHRTFLDVEDEKDRSTCSRRSQSEPPDDRSTEQTYASALASRADQLHFWLRKRQQGDFNHADEKETGAEASTEADTRDNTDSLRISSKNSNASEPEVEISQGSLGHPEVPMAALQFRGLCSWVALVSACSLGQKTSSLSRKLA